MNTTIYSDAPEVRALCLAAFPDYKGRKFSVSQFHPGMSITSMWGGGSKNSYALVDIISCKVVPLPEGFGKLDALADGIALVEYCIFAGKHLGCRAYVRPENLTPLLGDATSSLPTSQRVVLIATRNYKSSCGGRKNIRLHNAVEYTGITAAEYDAAKAALVESGHLTKAGAITDKGRNAVGDASFPGDLRAELDLERQGAEHFTHEVNLELPLADEPPVAIVEPPAPVVMIAPPVLFTRPILSARTAALQLASL